MDIASLIVVTTFLTLLLMYGLLNNKIDTFQRFAIGDKNFKTGTLIATLIATKFGGKILFSDVQYTYTHGFYYIFTIIFPLDFFIVGQFLAPRMQEFLTHCSVAESMGFLFGRQIRIITAISGILQLVGFTSIQFHAIAKIINLCFLDVDGIIALYVAMFVVLLYTMWGGIKAVSYTDLIQLAIFSILLPALLYLLGQCIDNLKWVTTLFTDSKNFNVRNVLKIDSKLGDTIYLLLMRIIPGMSPVIMQRLYMAVDVRQVKSLFIYSAWGCFILRTQIILLAILLVVVNPNLNAENLIDYITVLYPSYWVKILICMSVLALAMSTADSCLNTGSILFSNDVASYVRYFGKNKLLLGRFFTFIMCGLSMLLAFYEKDLLQLAIHACSFYEPIVTVPFIMAILGFRPQNISVLLGMVAGTLTVIGSNYFRLENCFGRQNAVILAMAMNLLFLVGSYYVLPKSISTKDK